MSGEAPDLPPSLPWRTRISMSVLSALTDIARRPNGTVNRRLVSLFDRKVSPNPTPLNGVKTTDVVVDSTRNLWFRLFHPIPSHSHTPIILFFHGGGFAFLGPDSIAYDAVCRRFSRELPAFVISVNYRLSPEHKYPSQYQDGSDILAYLDGNPTCLPDNADPTRIFLFGDSAGANLAHHVAVRAVNAELRNVRIVGQISVQPFFGGSERTDSELRLSRAPLVSVRRTDWMWEAFLPAGADRSHEACDVSGSNRYDLSCLDYPPTLLVVGGLDPLQDWQRKFHRWLQESGKEVSLVDYPTACHAFYIFPELPQASLLMAEVKKFLQSCECRI